MKRKPKVKHRGTGPIKRFAKCIDLPDFATGLDECIEVWGGNTVQVEGAKGIHTYERETVKIHMKKYLLVIRGENFDLAHFGESTLRVTGKIRQIEWEEME
ncbi:MAG: YabP/YqfC family sporulation protein [Clostridia bacterium]|nr:YabP/YqfC family sporulation protein [Clostridia bacterium]